MKKILSILFLLAFAFISNAQSTSPRFGTSSNQNQTLAPMTAKYAAPAYASTYTVSANAYETIIVMGQLTGAQTLTAAVTKCYLGDKLCIIFAADGTDRIVTFSTGFASGGTLTIGASTKVSVDYTFNGVGWVQSTVTNLVTGLAGDGTVGAPGIAFTSDPDNGFYRIGANHYAASVGGSKVVDYSTTGVTVTGALSSTTQSVPTITRTATAINTTATVTAAQLAGGLLTSTSAAAVTMTLPTATAMASQIGATQGTTFDFVVDNSAGSNTVTVAVGSGIVASGFPGTNTLTLANSATIGTAVFRLTFISTTAATLARVN